MRILFVAMADSVHSVRWITQLQHTHWDLHLFPSHLINIHPDFSHITIHNLWRSRPRDLAPSVIWRSKVPLRKGVSTAQRLTSHLPRFSDTSLLAGVIKRLRPDIVHSLEMQHAGYLTLEARLKSKQFPPWVVTNWGSDIYYYQRFPEHAVKIRSILENCDYYSCECERDIKLAKEFGFKGRTFSFPSNAGGLDIQKCLSLKQHGATSTRRWILLKGYQGWTGRALCGLAALEKCADLIKARGYQIGIYVAEPEVRHAAKRVSECSDIPITIIEPCSHEEMLQWHGRSRISIGLSLSDGASTSFLEALMMGAFPIQSCTACPEEWIINGKTGYIVPPEDVPAISSVLKHALLDDKLVDSAAAVNTETAAKRLNRETIIPQVVAMYEEVSKH